MPASKQDFEVTPRAGRWVAGRSVRPGDVLSLTEHEAEYELGLGYLIRLGASSSLPPPPVDGADTIASQRGGALHLFTVADLVSHVRADVLSALAGLPTSLPAAPGALWNNNGALSVS